jgi:serine phosphatase RsbU (regulator of sigma subunit)
MAYGKSGQYETAFEYQNLFVAMNDSIQSINNSRIITEMNTKYETDKKQKENELLQAQNQLSAATIKQQRIITWLVIGGLLITLVLAFFIFKGLKQQRKANKIISVQKKEVEKQKDLVEEKQKEIIDSINYAKRIQSSLLANRGLLEEHVPDSFIFFKPKDIVSGDFYWATSVRSNANSELITSNPIAIGSQLFYLAVCDSTGHGVPGAFMSLLNIGFLSEAIKEKGFLQPNEVFNYVRQRLVDSISQEGQKDGFDGILLCIDKGAGKITYAAANNNPVIVSNGRLTNLPCDNMPVGKGERNAAFGIYEISAQPGDTIYLFTDGYPDQFGGPKGKKFKYKQLEELLLRNSGLAMQEQLLSLEGRFNEWKGNLEQIDDVLVIGIRI